MSYSFSHPAHDAASVTPSDASDLAITATKGLYVGGAGDLTVVMEGGTTVALSNVPAGTYHPISVSRVMATGTTATDIVALY